MTALETAVIASGKEEEEEEEDEGEEGEEEEEEEEEGLGVMFVAAGLRDSLPLPLGESLPPA